MNRLLGIIRAILFCLASFLILERPVLADSIIGWGIFGAETPLFMALGTGGLSLVAVAAIETWIFARYLKISLMQAFGGAIAVNIFSTLAGFACAFVFSGGIIMMVVVPIALIVAANALRKKGAPVHYVVATIVTIIIGTFGAAITLSLVPPVPPRNILIALLLPMLLGFGLSLWLEGICAIWYFKRNDIWKAVLLANLASYILLAFLVPFHPRNPFGGSDGYTLSKALERRIEDGNSADQLIDSLHQLYASNLYLLGFVKDNPPPDNFNAGIELRLLDRIYLKYPEIAKSIADDTLSYPGLESKSKVRLEWIQGFLGNYLAAQQAVRNEDVDSLISIREEWTEWDKEHIYVPDRNWLDREQPHPDQMISELLVEGIAQSTDPMGIVALISKLDSAISLRLDILQQTYLNNSRDPAADPEIGLALVEDALTDPSLGDAAREKLVWFQGYFNFWVPIRKAIMDNDQATMDRMYLDWVNWCREHHYPHAESGQQWDAPSLPAFPMDVIEHFGSTVKVPGP